MSKQISKAKFSMAKFSRPAASATVAAVAAVCAVTVPAHADLPKGLCQVACKGGVPVPAFDYLGKGAAYGKDPFSGAALGSGGSVKLPEANNNGATTAPAGEAYGQLQKVENWSATQCGSSLSSGGDNETIFVYVPCASDALKKRWASVVTNAHGPGIKAPSKEVGDAFFDAVTSPAAQQKLSATKYLRLGPDGTKPKAIDQQSCGDKTPFEIGDRSLFAAGMNAKACRKIAVSAPTKKLGGNFWYEDGLPADARVDANVNSSVFAYVFGKQFVLLGAAGAAAGPQTGVASTSATFTKLGETVAIFAPASGAKVNPSNTYDIGQYDKGVEATFAIGPIPITVEGGFKAKAAAYAAGWASKMWAGVQTKPFIDSAAYAKAYVNLYVVKAGVEGTLQLVYNEFLNHAASLAAVAPMPETGNQDTFIYSYQVSGENHLKMLSGHVDAFAKVMVPKFIGIRWKRYGIRLFDWTGISVDGYLYSDMKNNTPFHSL